ncbi:tannase/feruloyl esterase family alpha/beta hydrolase [Wenxinia marina]|uniref:Serine protease of the peptidase family S9A n=1 Tax=Wenxinia marina DSM 24838 TaxID=1123501 RepID=A0A0D0PEK1_9RHOB|nr:tannase/feruloyl esterase family alpha/beta hydrolase [Wenxinia marina]KIQ69831.1 Serine protease of the peptidase family S9A [Wenxinia marina DSM 24838]GGL61584.1 chlorogenate esterase [Wenxinia marina]
MLTRILLSTACLLPFAAHAQSPNEDAAITGTGDCAALLGVAAFDTIVSRAEEVTEAGTSFCLVQGVIEPRIGAGGRSYGTGFELRLPADWNGRFLFQGGGGWDGAVQPAVGVIDRTNPDDTALSRGFAVASTDAGHSGDSPTDGWYGIDMKARADNGFNSVRLVTERTADLMARFYGTDPRHSYFMGCSNGGRQGMVSAVRLPEAFDGVLSGAPALDLTPAIIAWNWNTRALIDAAEDGAPASAFTDEELAMVSEAAVAACDAADGAEDGLVFDTSCTFEPATLQCEAGQTDGCLSEAQVTALEKIQAGPSGADGEVLYTGWPLADIEGPSGWRAWILGRAPAGAASDAVGFSFSQGWMRTVGSTPPRPDFDAMTFDIDDRDWLLANEPVFAATSTDYQAFADNGGKVIWWHGTADPAFSVRDFTGWLEGFRAANGRDFSRAYLVPGMHHCGGGPGLQSFDGLTPLVEWVENGTPPDALTASMPDGSLERPLCDYPAHAVPEGDGFTCSEG